MKIHRFTSLAMVMCMLVMSGCRPSSTAPGVDRQPSAEPVFGRRVPQSVAPRNSVDFSFVNENHFACLAIDLPALMAAPGLDEVPWSTLETQMATALGPKHADLSDVKRVWILLDRRGLDFQATEPVDPTVIVLEYASPIDRAQLAEVNQEAATDADASQAAGTPPSSTHRALALSDRRIAWGAAAQLESLTRPTNGSTQLTTELQQLKFTGVLEGAISVDPVRDLLTMTTSMFKLPMIQETPEMVLLRKLPQALQSMTLRVSLDQDPLWQSQVKLDDPDLAQQLVELINQPAGGNGSPGMPGLSQLGNLGALAGGDEKRMIDPTTPPWLEKVLEEIRQNELFQATADNGGVSLTLRRPKDTEPLVRAMLDDALAQWDLLRRFGQLTEIAAALEAYEQAHGCLPPAGPMLEDNAALPRQFNWRVGLLPYLGEQTLYDQFDFGQPWDSPNNLKAAQQIPSAFAGSAEAGSGGRPGSPWRLVNGPGSLYADEATPKLSSLTDVARYTALVVEQPFLANTLWTDPGSAAPLEGDIGQLGQERENGLLFAAADFKVRAVRRDSGNAPAILTAKADDTFRRSDLIPLGLGQLERPGTEIKTGDVDRP